MAAGKRKKGISPYILPILFCGLLVALAVLNGQRGESPVKAVLQESEPLTLTEQALENYLYADGFLWTEGIVLNGGGNEAAQLTAEKGDDGSIKALALAFMVPTYYETEGDSDILSSLKAAHDEAVAQGEAVFLSLFDAISVTDARVNARRDGALEKLHKAMDTGKAAAQSAGNWHFSFSFKPGTFSGTVSIRLEKAS